MSDLAHIRTLLDKLEKQERDKPKKVDSECQTDPVDCDFINDWYLANKRHVNVLFNSNCGDSLLYFREQNEFTEVDPDEDSCSEDYRVAFKQLGPVKTPDFNTFAESEGSLQSEPSLKKARTDPEKAICPKCNFSCNINDVKAINEQFGYANHGHGVRRQSWCKNCRKVSWEKKIPEHVEVKEEEQSAPGTPDSTIMNRKDNYYLIENPSTESAETGYRHPPPLRIKMKVKGALETWEQAEQRHRQTSHPLIRKRMKCMAILAQQEGTTISEQMKKLAGVTTTELFIRCKKESPRIISSQAESDDEEGDKIS